MNRLVKLLVTVILTVSIPIQGFAAAVMPACNMSSSSMSDNTPVLMHSTSVAMDMSTDQSSHDDMMGCCQHNKSSKSCTDQKCYVCHLSLFQLPVTGLFLIASDATSVYQNLTTSQYQTFHPPLFHPPKSISA